MNVPAAPSLSLLVVHWRDETSLAALLAALPTDDPRFEILVIDNGARAPLAVPPHVRLVVPGTNLGFGGGANLAASLAHAPLLLVLNPDVVPGPGALEALVEGFAGQADAAGLAPRLVGDDGRAQTAWQLRTLPTPGTLLRHALFRDPVARATGEPLAGAAVEQPAAAALALRRDAWERVGGFDATFHPAWFEDVDLARRLAAAGATLRYWPAAEMHHRLGGSVAPLGYGRFLWIYHRNLGRYLAKHHGRGWAWLARAVLVGGALARATALPLRTPRRASSRGEALRGLLVTMLGALSAWTRPRALGREAG